MVVVPLLSKTTVPSPLMLVTLGMMVVAVSPKASVASEATVNDP